MTFRSTAGLRDIAEEAAQAGGREVMARWRDLTADQVSEKAANDLVTAADTAAETAILKVLRRRCPEHAVVAEESGRRGRTDGRPTWIVDPLDGTTNYVHGFPQFAVSVAVAEGEELLAGAILDPLKNDLFTAALNEGATLNGTPCRVTSRPGIGGALLATGFPFKAHELIDAYLAIFRATFLRAKAIRRPGAAALDLAYVACGIFDGFFEFRLSPWDVAAGALLVHEAGGRVSDMHGGPGFLESGDVVAGAPGVHRELLATIRATGVTWSRNPGDEPE